MREPNTIPDIRRLNAPNQLPTPDGYWVVPGLLLAGESPGDRMEAEARRKLRRFLDGGITYFLDLTEEDEGLEPYAGLLQDEAAARGQSDVHHRAPNVVNIGMRWIHPAS